MFTVKEVNISRWLKWHSEVTCRQWSENICNITAIIYEGKNMW